jgi:hypothetical protein
MEIKEKLIKELSRVEYEIECDGEQERALLEGWQHALKWVINEIEGEGK